MIIDIKKKLILKKNKTQSKNFLVQKFQKEVGFIDFMKIT